MSDMADRYWECTQCDAEGTNLTQSQVWAGADQHRDDTGHPCVWGTIKDEKAPESADDYSIDFGEPNPVIVTKTYTEVEVREAQAVALEEAAHDFAKRAKNVRNNVGIESGIEFYGEMMQHANELDKAALTLRARAVTVRGGE